VTATVTAYAGPAHGSRWKRGTRRRRRGQSKSACSEHERREEEKP